MTYRVLEHGEAECERSKCPTGCNGTQPSLLEGEAKEVKTSSVGDTGCFKTEKSIRKELRSRSVGKGNEKKNKGKHKRTIRDFPEISVNNQKSRCVSALDSCAEGNVS